MQNINPIHVKKSIDQIKKTSLPAKFDFRTKAVLYEGKMYPVKEVIRIAYQLANKQEMTKTFVTTEAESILVKLGFTIVPFEK
jgi:hypothetical protein